MDMSQTAASRNTSYPLTTFDYSPDEERTSGMNWNRSDFYEESSSVTSNSQEEQPTSPVENGRQHTDNYQSQYIAIGSDGGLQRNTSDSSNNDVTYLHTNMQRESDRSSKTQGYVNNAFIPDSQNGDTPNNPGFESTSTLETTVSQLSCSQSTSRDFDRTFTVQNQESNAYFDGYKKPSKVLSAFKFTLSLLLACLTLVCVVASKMSVVSLVLKLVDTRYFYNSTHSAPLVCSDDENLELCSRETAFVMLGLLLIIPPAYTIIKTYLLTCRKTAHPWPTKLAIMWIFIGTLLEVMGITLFFIGIVINVSDADIIIILMNALFIFPVIFQFFKECQAPNIDRQMNLPAHLYKKRQTRHTQNMLLAGVAFIFQFGGVTGILYMLWDLNEDKAQLFVIPMSIVFVSIAWSPKIRKLQIDHDLAYVWSDEIDIKGKGNLPKNDRVKYLRPKDFADDTSSEDSKMKKKENAIKDDAKNIIIQTNTSRGKSTIIACFLRVIFMPIFVTIFVYLFGVADISKAYEGFVGITYHTNMLYLFLVHVIASFIGYHTLWIGCMISLQRLCFAIPLTLSTPICIAIFLTGTCEVFGLGTCRHSVYDENASLDVMFSIALWLGQFFATTYYTWKSQDFIMADEAMLFWVPTYDGSLLEQNLLLNRKNEATNEFVVNYRKLVKKSCVYICTTMYHEADYEMEQLLRSIGSVDRARRSDGRIFESHIWFDDGVRDTTLKVFAIQLISLLSDTLHINPEAAIKLNTPYGMELKWTLPGGMPFHVHLKDNFKVKNKKRWSQVMYMSYVLDYRDKGDLANSFILTTDADVKFRPEDVTALMDFMSRDPSVGAVCGRTQPMGSGPLVWYQIFDYAIGHWLLKVAEHVLGSVLCSPGCFSVYRCCALQDILPTYATSVECAMDFLTKDMGEDRWLCTLMIEKGWRLDYCASSSDSTYCPDTFDEFFKQRRRWGPSTIANQIVLIQNQMKIRKRNDDINLLFICYQILMMISTMIGPGTVLLVVSSGMHTAYPSHFDLTEMFCINFFVAVFYVVVCLYTTQRMQLRAAKMLTFVYSIVMTITIVGLMVQVADDLEKQRTEGYQYYLKNITDTYIIPKDQSIRDLKVKNETVIKEFVWQFTPPTIFLFFLVGLFLMTALLHGLEGIQLLHGLWYLLCLPSGYIFLMIYSLVNITDRSWGTRESVLKPTNDDDAIPWYHQIWFKFKEVFFCCFDEDGDYKLRKKKTKTKTEDIEIPIPKKRAKYVPTNEEEECLLSSNISYETEQEEEVIILSNQTSVTTDVSMSDERRQVRFARYHNNKGNYQTQRRPRDVLGKRNYYVAKQDSLTRTWGNGYNQNGIYIGYADSDSSDYYITMNIEDWLDGPYSKYVKFFIDAGYDDTTFLMGMKEQELIDVGIANRGHRKRMLAEIERLPPEQLDQDVPENVEEWLMLLGLHDYWPEFESNSYAEPNALADLKLMDKYTLSAIFNMTKAGHLKKLMKAVKQLKYPTAGQRKIRQAKLALERVPLQQLAHEVPFEFEFWDRLRKICLLTEQGAFSQSEELQSKLYELRNTALVVFAVSNILWLSIMMAILNQGKKLTILKSSFLSVGFLAVYALLMQMQFGALLVHRVSTWLHFISRTPSKPGDNEHKMWSFRDEDLPSGPSSDDINEVRETIDFDLRRRSERRNLEANERVENVVSWRTAYYGGEH